MTLDLPSVLSRETSPRDDRAAMEPAVVLAGNRARGRAHIGFECKDGITRLSTLHHSQPLRVLFPRRASGDIPCAALTCVAGGIAGGDRHDIRVSTGRRAQAMVIGQAPEKIYRSLGDDAVLDIGLEADAGSWLEWLPQETILFDGARLRRRSRARVADGAMLLAGEITVLGRRASGEIFSHGDFFDDWEIYGNAGSLLWKDVFRLSSDIAGRTSDPACLDNAHAIATLILAAPGHRDISTWLKAVRSLELTRNNIVGGATRLGDVLLVRLAASAVREARRLFAELWQTLRNLAGNLPPRLPQLWHI